MQTDSMPVNQWAYNAELAALCGPDVKLPPAWSYKLHRALVNNILGRPDTFRDVWSAEEQALYDEADAACADVLQQHRLKRQQPLSRSGV